MEATSEAGPGILAIDTMMTGRERMTCAYLVLADRPALIDTGPASSAATVLNAMSDLGFGPGDLAHIVATHIHLDHSGGVGVLARAFPTAQIWVHERGAPHLADPSRLVKSAARLYGEETLLSWFGVTEPAPEDRLRIAEDGSEIDLGGRRIRFAHTPGHASHHVSAHDLATGAVFSGDAVGVHLPGASVIRPAAPPPEFDPDLAIASIEKTRAMATRSILFAHFGPTIDVDDTCDAAIEAIRKWTEVARSAPPDDPDRLAVLLSEADSKMVSGLRATDLERLEILASYRSNAMGLSRYWRKRREAERSSR